MLGLGRVRVNGFKVWMCLLFSIGAALSLVTGAMAQSQTPTPNPTLQAGASGDFPQGSPIQGPLSGELPHTPDDGLVSSVYLDITVANFVAEVDFINPYDPTPTGWSHGFFFRDHGDGQYRLIFDSQGNWELTLVSDGEFISQQTGILANVFIRKGERNTVRLAADGRSGLFAFNGQIIAALDLSLLLTPGDFGIGTGMYTGTEVRGAATEYENFSIWSIGILPTLTPTATAVPATFRAVVGTNRGEIAIGGGQVWNYEGVEGERLSIRINAERPAGRGTTQAERLEQNLLDTYLIIRAPDGSVIAENDDNEEVPEDDVAITNSFITITLPRSGLYQIEVRSYDDDTGGAYTLQIDRVRQFTPQGGAAATATPTAGASEGRG